MARPTRQAALHQQQAVADGVPGARREVEGKSGVIRAKIWKWPVGHPVYPAGGWAWAVSSAPGMWWPAASHEDALAYVARHYEAMKELRP